MTPELESWSEYRKLVLAELKRLNLELERTNEKLDRLRFELSDKLEKSWIDMNAQIQSLKREFSSRMNEQGGDIRELKVKAAILCAGVATLVTALVNFIVRMMG